MRSSVADANETELIRGLREGREETQRLFWDLHYEALYRHVELNGARNRSTADAEEITSDAFRRAFRDVGAFRGDSTLRTWLFALARNAAKDYYRLAANKYPPARTVDAASVVHDVAAPPYGVGAKPEAKVLSRERRDQLRRVLAQLTEDQRAVVTRRIIDGLSVRDTAKAMEKTEAAVKMLLLRALRTLGPMIKSDSYFADYAHEEEVADEGE